MENWIAYLIIIPICLFGISYFIQSLILTLLRLINPLWLSQSVKEAISGTRNTTFA